MNATRDQKFDFVFFKIKEKGKFHPLPMWQKYESEMIAKYQIDWNDLLKIFESLKSNGHIYQDNENEYHIHPDYVDFLGFVNESQITQANATKTVRFEKLYKTVSVSIAAISVITVIIFGTLNYKKAEEIDKLKSSNDSLEIELKNTITNYVDASDSILKLQKQIQMMDTVLK
jgi:hypothetical protein